MLFGPVFTAEVVTGARRTRHIVLRVLYGAVLLMALLMVYAEYDAPWRGSPGTVQHYAAAAATFFGTYAILQLLGVFFVAPALTAGTIASERERRTIEYLFATDLSNWEIIIGKLSAALLRSLALLLVGPPILALAMWMGGVGPDRLFIVFVVTLSTLVAVTSLALAVSVWSPRARQAYGRIYFYLLALLVLPPFVYALSMSATGLWPAWLLPYLEIAFGLNRQLLAANPFYVLSIALTPTAGAATGLWRDLGLMILYHALLSTLCIGTSLFAVRRIHLRSASSGVRVDKALRARRGPGGWAMLWKEIYTERSANKLGVAGKLLLVGLLIGVGALTGWMFYLSLDQYNGARGFNQYTATIGIIGICAGILFVGMRGATSISSERERDTLPVLLSTPLEVSEILLAKWLAAVYSVRWLLCAVAVLGLLAAARSPKVLLAIPGVTFSTAILVAFSAMLGVWYSLWCKTSTRALGCTMATLIFLGGAYLFFGICCTGVLGVRGGEEFVLALAPCQLFLLIAPIFLPDALTTWHGNGEVVYVFMAYALGTIGYIAGAAALYQVAISQFDRWTGRTHSGFELASIGLPAERVEARSPGAGILAQSEESLQREPEEKP